MGQQAGDGVIVHLGSGVFFLNIPIDHIGNRPQIITLMKLNEPNVGGVHRRIYFSGSFNRQQ